MTAKGGTHWPILVIDDELGQPSSRAQQSFLERVGVDSHGFVFSTGQREDGSNDAAVAVEAVRRGWPFPEGRRWSLVLLDVRFSGMHRAGGDEVFGFGVLEVLRKNFGPQLPIVMLTGEDEGRRRESGQRTATGFLPKEELSASRLTQVCQEHGLLPDERGILVGSSLPFLELLRILRRFGRYGSGELLLLGESGSGKTELARFVHDESGREGRFVYWSADPATKDLHYDQLFGHWAGAHSTASGNAAGKAEQAHRGTLFIDEVSELAPETQVQLLSFRDRDIRGLRSVRRLGGYEEAIRTARGGRTQKDRLDLHAEYDAEHDQILVDVICLFATNRDLRAPDERKAAGFREDLFHALGNPVLVPPLRERREDILPLFDAFLGRLRRSMGWRPAEIDTTVAGRLSGYEWPGNLRELKRAAEHVNVQLGGDFDCVTEHQLPESFFGPATSISKGLSAPGTVAPVREATEAAPPADFPAPAAGDLARCEVDSIARGLRVLRRAVDAASAAWHPGSLEGRISPTRIAELAVGIEMSTTLAQRVFKEALRPVFAPTDFQRQKWTPLAAYTAICKQALADPVVDALWRYGAGKIKRDEFARIIADELEKADRGEARP